MIGDVDRLNGLKQSRPEWQPWLAVVEQVVRETGSRRWQRAVPTIDPAHDTAAPLIAGAVLSVPANLVRRLLRRLAHAATLSQTSKTTRLDGHLETDHELLGLFTAGRCHDAELVRDIARRTGVDEEAFESLVALLPVPLLQACNARWESSIREDWVEGYCPVCASWPAFAEVRGIERSRFFRCGRCGSAWHARSLCCPYCAMTDHDELVTLVPSNDSSHATIEGCKGCLGYVKALTRLQGCLPGDVMLDDLATVDLDIAALDHGFTRPAGAGCPLRVTVTGGNLMERFRAAL